MTKLQFNQCRLSTCIGESGRQKEGERASESGVLQETVDRESDRQQLGKETPRRRSSFFKRQKNVEAALFPSHEKREFHKIISLFPEIRPRHVCLMSQCVVSQSFSQLKS